MILQREAVRNGEKILQRMVWKNITANEMDGVGKLRATAAKPARSTGRFTTNEETDSAAFISTVTYVELYLLPQHHFTKHRRYVPTLATIRGIQSFATGRIRASSNEGHREKFLMMGNFDCRKHVLLSSE